MVTDLVRELEAKTGHSRVVLLLPTMTVKTSSVDLLGTPPSAALIRPVYRPSGST